MTDPDLSTFGARVRHLRTMVPDLAQRELATLAGLHPGQTWQIEEGHRENPTRDTIIGLATVLGASVDWLVTGEGRPPSAKAVERAVNEARESRLTDAHGTR